MKILYFLVVLLTITEQVFGEISKHPFPKDFSFGAATAAFQIEGAWNEDNKGESIWDHWVHARGSKIIDNSTSDIACDSYHKYKEDIALAANLGLTHYRFSISWPRVLPTGLNNLKSLKGLMYYQNVVREIESYNMTPVVTMYHWDLPESLQDIGGWTNPIITKYFTDYAELLFESLRTVKYWITINEPKQVCIGGYGKASKAPFISESGIADYICVRHTILAHAAVYNLYKEKYGKLGGKISMGLDGAWYIPANKNEDDKEAAKRRLQFDFGLYAHPLYFGDWPDVVKERVDNRSTSENFATSRLTAWSKDEKSIITNTLDFLALNFYNTKLIANDEEANYTSVAFENDVRTVVSVDPSWIVNIDGNTVYPDGLKYFLIWLKDQYNNPNIFITENGIADDGTLDDDYRMYYLAEYLSAVLDAVYNSNVTVTGYTVWSLIDNFEWTEGYSLKFGLYSVNFSDANRTRTEKKSVDYYKQLIMDRKIPDLPDPTPSPPKTTSPSTTVSPTTVSPTTSSEEPKTTPKGSANRFKIGSWSILYIFIYCYLMIGF